jgi:hypothetical protein
MRSKVIVVSLGLLITLILPAGCGLADGKDTVGMLVQSWSQGEDEAIQRYAPKDTLVLADRASRDRFLAQLPAEADRQPTLAVDLSRNFLVLGSYHKCMDRSRVWMDSRRTAVWLEDYIPRQHRQTNCAWSPLTVDVWAVPRDELAETPVEQLRTSEP